MRSLLLMATVALFPSLVPAAGPAAEPAAASRASAFTDDACPPTLPVPPALAALREAENGAGVTDADRNAVLERAEVKAYFATLQERARADWPNLCRYRADNAALRTPPRVVFLGDSITENWIREDPSLFGAAVVDRGISGQTTPQMLLRFFQDVVELHPRVVHIMAGTNDLAGNTGPSTMQDFRNNITAMVELAHAHGIRVVLASIPPAAAFPWRPGLRPAADVLTLNRWLRSYATASGSAYVDYHAVLTDGKGGLRSEFSGDGVHPNREGYAAMRPLTLKAIGAGAD